MVRAKLDEAEGGGAQRRFEVHIIHDATYVAV
jgi:hypothetical protein